MRGGAASITGRGMMVAVLHPLSQLCANGAAFLSTLPKAVLSKRIGFQHRAASGRFLYDGKISE